VAVFLAVSWVSSLIFSNTNCLPNKNEIWSAKIADLVHHADRFGMVTGSTVVDMKSVLARKREMVDGLIAMHLENYKASGADLIMGAGRFIAPRTIEVSLNDGAWAVLVGSPCARVRSGSCVTSAV
jgi:pyruvate/2-oxoglutarate dehydrogenase complex dihydrolipoamide dehydrogenase (E3) component